MNKTQQSPCLGCQLANGKTATNTVYENELVTCILDIAPLNEGHVLILPKRHYHDVEELDEETANEIMKTSKLLAKLLKSHYNPDGITIMQNNGVFNELTHYHMHVFPRFRSDGFSWVEPNDSTNAKARLKETAETLVASLKQLLR